MGQSIAVKFGEKELSALNARMDALSMPAAAAWEEAIDWGVPDCRMLYPFELRMTSAPDLD